VTYDLITTIWEKLKGLEALDEYLEDVDGDQALTSTLQQIRQQDAVAIQQLLPFLGQRLR
jgi:hypothetical protein